MKAIVFVDVQNDFVQGGKLAYGFPQFNNVPDIIKFAKECRSKGWQLYATVDTHEISTYNSTLEGQKLPVAHCIEGTDGHKIVDGLVKDTDGIAIIPQGHIIDKSTFGSYDLITQIDHDFMVDTYGKPFTNMSFGLKEPLEEIILCGYCLSICVMANALMLRAKYPNVKISVRTDLCGDVDQFTFGAAVKVLKMQQIDVLGTESSMRDIYNACQTAAELDAEEAKELAYAKAGMAIAEAKLGDKSKYAGIPNLEDNLRKD